MLYGGGTLCPDVQSISCGSQVEASNLLPFSEFVPWNLRQALLESFLEFFFENIKKHDFKNFRPASTMTRKLKKLKKKIIFSKKLYFFLVNLNCTCSQVSFEVYIVSVGQNLEILTFFARKFFSTDLRHSTTLSDKNTLLRGLFLVSMER